jgi:transcriptional regulator with XRE-family HTH domain
MFKDKYSRWFIKLPLNLTYSTDMECTELLKVLGDRVRAVRKSRKISQERLAELAGLHPVFVSKLETGKVKASVCTYHCIAEALNMRLAELMELPGENESSNNDLVVLFQSAKSLDNEKQKLFIETVRGVLTGLGGS